MKKTAILFITLSFLISSCMKNHKIDPDAINPKDMKLTVKAGDDFFRYSNGSWLDKLEMPADKNRYGAFDILRETNKNQVKTLLKEVNEDKTAKAGSNTQKIRDFYASGMNTEKIEKDGAAPVVKYLNKIDGINSYEDLQYALIQFYKKGSNPLFYFASSQDSKNSDQVIALLWQGGLGLPDQSYYVKEDDRSKDIRVEYEKHIAKMFELTGMNPKEAAKYGKTAINMEIALAKSSNTRLENRDAVKRYNPKSQVELKEFMNNFDFSKLFTELNLTHYKGIVNVAQPRFFENLNKMLKNTPVEDWKIFLKWKTLNSSSSYLSKAFVDQDFNFYSKYLSGTKEQEPRWKRVQSTVSGYLGEAIGQLYVAKYFPPAAKERMTTLVLNLKKALANRIENKNKWMSDATKKEALAKLNNMNFKIGYPDKWRNYSDLNIKADSYLENVMRSRQFEADFDLAKIGKPVDKEEWGMTPQTVNAYFHPLMNEIVFPAAILQPPFFNMKADDAVNYGAIGVVIGHEITHGFDDQGRNYDKDGNLRDWWTKEDAEKFTKEADLLVAQYNKFSPFEGEHVDGNLTLGENIADFGGLTIAYEAFKTSLAKEPAKIDSFTADQRFFLSYAKIWRGKTRDKYLKRLLKEDVHSPGEYRVNGALFNVPEFYAAFNITEGKLFIKPENRPVIW